MRRRIGRLAALGSVALSVLALGTIAAPAGSAATAPASRCSGITCLRLQLDQSGYTSRGHAVRVGYDVFARGRADHVVLTVHQDQHFPIVGDGAVLIDGARPPAGVVVAHRDTLTVDLSARAPFPAGMAAVSYDAVPDSAAATDLHSSARVTYFQAGGGYPAGYADARMTTILDRPVLSVWALSGIRVRAGGDEMLWVIVENLDTVAAPKSRVTITLPKHFALGKKWGFYLDNRRFKCRGSGRHWTCSLPRLTDRTIVNLGIDVHAARGLHRGHSGVIKVVATAMGYQNSTTYNHARLRVKIKR